MNTDLTEAVVSAGWSSGLKADTRRALHHTCSAWTGQGIQQNRNKLILCLLQSVTPLCAVTGTVILLCCILFHLVHKRYCLLSAACSGIVSFRNFSLYFVTNSTGSMDCLSTSSTRNTFFCSFCDHFHVVCQRWD